MQIYIDFYYRPTKLSLSQGQTHEIIITLIEINKNKFMCLPCTLSPKLSTIFNFGNMILYNLQQVSNPVGIF
jgi:hypothetical protein